MPSSTSHARGGRRGLRCDAQANLERILASAKVVFAELGLEAKLVDVAKHAGVGVGTVYRRFASKDELIEALFLARVDDIVEIADTALADDDAWNGLVYFLRMSAGTMADNQGLRDLMMSGRFESPAFAEARRQMAQRVAVLVERAKTQGTLRADFQPTDVPAIMWTIQASRDFAGALAPDLWQRQLGFVIDGLRASRTGVSDLESPAITPDRIARIMSMRRGSDQFDAATAIPG